MTVMAMHGNFNSLGITIYLSWCVFEARPPERETMYRNKKKESKLEISSDASACNCVKYFK